MSTSRQELSLDYQITGDWIYLRPAQLLEMLECAFDGVFIDPLEELLGILNAKALETQRERDHNVD